MTIEAVLPQQFTTQSIDIRLEAFTAADWENYQQVYTDNNLMRLIAPVNDEWNLTKNFKLLIAEHHRQIPRYRSYQIFHQKDYIGILGLKWHVAGGKADDSHILEIGVIILENHQHFGWSKKIKAQVFEYVFKHLSVRQVIAYCHHDNEAANYVNQSLGMCLKRTYLHPKKQVKMNKWLIDLQKKQEIYERR